jgi:hypothetical protein
MRHQCTKPCPIESVSAVVDVGDAGVNVGCSTSIICNINACSHIVSANQNLLTWTILDGAVLNCACILEQNACIPEQHRLDFSWR